MPEASPAHWVPEGPSWRARLILQSAIAAASAGHYRQALQGTDEVIALGDPGGISAGHALRASILRQLHRHDDAQEADHLALEHAVGGPNSDTRIDALIGLAADAVFRPDLALERLEHLVPLLAAASIRCRVRAGWVGAEVHLAANQPTAALGEVLAIEPLAAAVSTRHRAKTLLVLGVCQVAAGRHEQGIASVCQAADLAEQGHLRPLLVPCAFLLARWLPGSDGEGWWERARLTATTIAAGLPPDLLAGWRTDPAIADLFADLPADLLTGPLADSPAPRGLH